MKLAIIVACLVPAACGERVEEKPKHADARATPFDPLTDQLDRAKVLEDTVEQHKRDLD